MKRLATSPYGVLVLAAAAALLSLGLGRLSSWSSPERPVLDPLAALQSPTLCPSFDVAFWSRLAAEEPGRVIAARAYCARHHDRPNCQALATASFLASLRRQPAQGHDLPPASSPQTTSFPEP